MKYYRTFIGVPINPGPSTLQLRDSLIRALEGERISWVDPAQYHVTLRFLGETEIIRIRDIIKGLDSGVKLPVKTHLILTGPESFGEPNRPRVVWLGFRGSELFGELKKEVDRALEASGIPGENRVFNAHLTLGRIRGLRNIRNFYRVLEDLKGSKQEEIRVEKMIYYRSVLGKGAPSYIPLAGFPFRD